MSKLILSEDIIKEAIVSVLQEAGFYTDTSTPLPSRAMTRNMLGRNPVIADNGNHASRDTVVQPSSIDFNGEDVTHHAQHYFVSDNKFQYYMAKNFGSLDRFQSTVQMMNGTVAFNNAIHAVYGSAQRSGKRPILRSISPETKKNSVVRSGYLSNTFWEFSYDGGNTWYVLTARPAQTMKQSTVKIS